MRRAPALLLIALLSGKGAGAAEVAYPGPPGGAAEKAAEAVRARWGADRLVADDTGSAVASQVRAGAAAFGLVPTEELRETLLAALDPGLRILRRVEQGGEAFWAVERPAGKPDDHPDHVALNLEGERGGKAFSDVVEGMDRLGFSVEDVARIGLPGAGQDGRPLIRWMIVFTSDKPLLLLRITDTLARDVRVGDGRARLIGAWRQAG